MKKIYKNGPLNYCNYWAANYGSIGEFSCCQEIGLHMIHILHFFESENASPFSKGSSPHVQHPPLGDICNLPLITDNLSKTDWCHNSPHQQFLKYTKAIVTSISSLNSILISATLTQNVPTGKPSKCKMIKKTHCMEKSQRISVRKYLAARDWKNKKA